MDIGTICWLQSANGGKLKTETCILITIDAREIYK